MNSTDPTDMQWRKSSHSNGQANCVEVATVQGERPLVAIRDSKGAGDLCLVVTTGAWQRLIDNVEVNIIM